MTLPLVGVCRRKYLAGATSLSDENLSSMTAMPLDEAMSTCFDTDAHFVPYVMSEGESWVSEYPRCNKRNSSVLQEIRARGGNLWTTCLVFDYDHPKMADGTKQRWTAELWDEFEKHILDALDRGLPLAFGWTWLYTTTHGARLVYALEAPVPVEEAEGLLLGVVRDFLLYGIQLDPLKDWTRLFRLPRVTRRLGSGEVIHTWEDEHFQEVRRVDVLLDSSKIVPDETHAGSSHATYDQVDEPLPDPHEARALVEVGGTLTQWAKEAKKMLTGRDVYSCLFEHAPIAASGERNSTIHKFVGQACAMVRHITPGTPQHVFGLFVPTIEQLVLSDPDDDEDFFSTLWRAVCLYWSAETARIDELQAQQEEFEQHRLSLEQRVVQGMRRWCQQPELLDDQACHWWASEHLIASTDTGMHLMTSSGHYDPVPVRREQMIARIRELRMQPMLPIEELRSDGKGMKTVLPQTLIDKHSTRIASVEGAIGIDGTHIRNVGTPNAVLVHRLYGRKNIEPRHDPEVDTWLHYLAPDEENYTRLCTWIGHALAFEDGPICALSLAGPPACGKKMLIQGLVECLDNEICASGKEFGKFQTLLLKTPFLVVNEGIAIPRNGAQQVADQFRHFVSGDPIYIEPKFREQILIRSPLRILFMANNVDVVRELCGNRDLTPDDRHALAERLFHFYGGERAAVWLRSRGGHNFTRGWIHADSGERGHFRVARHFLHLHAVRPPVPRGNRLLMQGNLDDELIRQMSHRSGSAPAVIEALINMIEATAHAPLPGLHIDGTQIWVTNSSIVNYHRAKFEIGSKVTLNTRGVGQVLKGLATTGGAAAVPRSIKGQKARWVEVDPGGLLREAIDHGYACHKLEQIVDTNSQISAQVEADLERWTNA